MVGAPEAVWLGIVGVALIVLALGCWAIDAVANWRQTKADRRREPTTR